MCVCLCTAKFMWRTHGISLSECHAQGVGEGEVLLTCVMLSKSVPLLYKGCMASRPRLIDNASFNSGTATIDHGCRQSYSAAAGVPAIPAVRGWLKAAPDRSHFNLSYWCAVGFASSAVPVETVRAGCKLLSVCR